MSNEVTKMENVINPEVMGDMLDAKIEAQLKLTPYAKVDTTLQGVPGDTKTVPSWNYIGDAEDIAEGEEVDTTKMTASSKTFTIKKAMKSVAITQEAVNSGLGDPIGTILKDSNFISADKYAPGVMVNGAIGKVAGCQVKKSKKVRLVTYEKATDGTVTITAETLAEYQEKVDPAVKLVAGDKVKAIASASQYYVCPVIKMEADSAETEYTEDELPAVTIFLKKDTSLDHDWYSKKQTHEFTTAKYYGVALTNSAKVVLAKFKK